MKKKFGDKFSNAINNIYSSQWTTIRINKEETEEFPVQKGTRQGCPLSPLLFIAVLNVFLGKLQKDEQYKGIKIKRYNFMYRAFADDIVFFMEDPLSNIQSLI